MPYSARAHAVSCNRRCSWRHPARCAWHAAAVPARAAHSHAFKYLSPHPRSPFAPACRQCQCRGRPHGRRHPLITSAPPQAPSAPLLGAPSSSLSVGTRLPGQASGRNRRMPPSPLLPLNRPSQIGEPHVRPSLRNSGVPRHLRRLAWPWPRTPPSSPLATHQPGFAAGRPPQHVLYSGEEERLGKSIFEKIRGLDERRKREKNSADCVCNIDSKYEGLSIKCVSSPWWTKLGWFSELRHAPN